MSGYSLKYARALFKYGVLEGSGREGHYGEMLSAFARCMGTLGELFVFLCGAHVNRVRKKAYLSEVFYDPDDRPFLNFLKVLVDKDRMDIVAFIDLEYHRLLNESKNKKTAIVESAFPLDEGTVADIQRTFAKITGAREIETVVRVLPELIGGIRVTIGSAMYDGTTRSELDRLGKAIKKIGV